MCIICLSLSPSFQNCIENIENGQWMHFKGCKSERANKNLLFIIYRIHPNSVTLNQFSTQVGFILSLPAIVMKHNKASQCLGHFLEILAFWGTHSCLDHGLLPPQFSTCEMEITIFSLPDMRHSEEMCIQGYLDISAMNLYVHFRGGQTDNTKLKCLKLLLASLLYSFTFFVFASWLCL